MGFIGRNAIGFAAYAAAKGHPVRTFFDDDMSSDSLLDHTAGMMGLALMAPVWLPIMVVAGLVKAAVWLGRTVTHRGSASDAEAVYLAARTEAKRRQRTAPTAERARLIAAGEAQYRAAGGVR